MMQRKQTSNEYFKTLNILYYALLSGQVIFGAVAVFIRTTNLIDSDFGSFENTLLFIFGIVVLFAIMGSMYLFAQKVNAIKKLPSLIEKSMQYRAALLIKLALVEFPVLLGTIAYIITGNYIFLIGFVAIILYFISLHPSRQKMINDLELSSVDRVMVQDPNAGIAESGYQVIN